MRVWSGIGRGATIGAGMLSAVAIIAAGLMLTGRGATPDLPNAEIVGAAMPRAAGDASPDAAPPMIPQPAMQAAPAADFSGTRAPPTGARTAGVAPTEPKPMPVLPAAAPADAAALPRIAVAALPGSQPAAPPAPVAAPEPAAVVPAAPPPAPATPMVADAPPQPPRFTQVRIAASGDAVVAGVALRRAPVAVLIDGTEVSRSTANARGDFAALFALPASAVPRVMTLLLEPEGRRIASLQSVIISPTEPPDAVAQTPGPAVPAAAVIAAAPPRAEPPEPAGASPLPQPAAPVAAADPADPATRIAEPAAPPAESAATADVAPIIPPTVLLADETGLRILQSPAAAGPGSQATPGVIIDTISYDAAGEIALAGRSPPGAALRLYLDNAPAADVLAASDGSWATRLAGIVPGTYRLRADAIDAAGRVTSRFETPFRRESPAALALMNGRVAAATPDATDAAQANRPAALTAAVITVQPGFTLWGIAQARYGSGIQYVQVFEANRDKIRDPDLIYPGQVFAFPQPPGDTPD